MYLEETGLLPAEFVTVKSVARNPVSLAIQDLGVPEAIGAALDALDPVPGARDTGLVPPTGGKGADKGTGALKRVLDGVGRITLAINKSSNPRRGPGPQPTQEAEEGAWGSRSNAR